MSGEVTVKQIGWASRLLALLLTGGLVLLVLLPILRSLHQSGRTGMPTQLGIALAAPLLIWLLHPQLMKLLDKKQSVTLQWRIENHCLTLGKETIPLDTIKQVHCWDTPSGFCINIETTGHNHLLRQSEEPCSLEQLRALADALKAV